MKNILVAVKDPIRKPRLITMSTEKFEKLSMTPCTKVNPFFKNKDIVMVYDDVAKYTSKPNIALYDEEKNMVDYIAGTIYIVGFTGGQITSLTDEMVNIISEYFSSIDVCVLASSEIRCSKIPNSLIDFVETMDIKPCEVNVYIDHLWNYIMETDFKYVIQPLTDLTEALFCRESDIHNLSVSLALKGSYEECCRRLDDIIREYAEANDIEGAMDYMDKHSLLSVLALECEKRTEDLSNKLNVKTKIENITQSKD